MPILRLVPSLPKVGMATKTGPQSDAPAVSSVTDEGRAPVLQKLTLRNAYFVTLFVAALVLLVAQAPALHGDALILLFLIGLNIVASLMPVSIYGESRVSIGFVITFSIIVIFGGPGVVILAPLAGLASGISRRHLDGRVIANASLYTVVYSVAAAGYGLFAETNPADVSFGMIPGAAAATLISFGLSAFLLSVPFYVGGQESPRSLWERHSWLMPHYVAMGIVGLALSASYIALGLVGIIAFVTPALMMRFSMKQYVDKTADNVEKLQEQNTALKSANVQIRLVSDELRTSYDGTLEALVKRSRCPRPGDQGPLRPRLQLHDGYRPRARRQGGYAGVARHAARLASPRRRQNRRQRLDPAETRQARR